ncbi:MAG: hypothetical protein GF311_04795 [Candidatus Lokiarchaeota archaeon]|nr:hypothetical protein [Candidatus Lokiarchaeota archaeon]
MEKNSLEIQDTNIELKGLPSSEDAPLVFMPRFKQPLSGIIALVVVLIISIITWYLLFDPRLHDPHLVHYASLIGGFGLVGVVYAIWFENWPYYERFKKPWMIGLVGTLINIAIALIFTFILLPLFNMFYGPSVENPDPFLSWYIGASIFGSLSGSTFSFGVLFVAGTMYWPFFKFKQPKRGIIVWVIGTIIGIIVWFILFFPAGNPTAPTEADVVYRQYAYSLGWTQWLIFFSLLTQLVFEYWPWKSLAIKQPYMGILCFFVCTIMGFIVSLVFPYLVQYIIDPIFLLAGGDPKIDIDFGLTQFKGWYVMSISYAIFLILAIVMVSLFFDNWPKRFSQGKNLIFRFLLVIGLGTVLFFAYYFLAPYLFGDPIGGEPNEYWNINPTPFLLWFLWIELLYSYVWKNWPIYKVYR